MFEIFKDQNNDLINERFSPKKLANKKGHRKMRVKEKQLSQNLKKKEETVLSLLNSLSYEEETLLVEKNQLLDIEETLKERIISEIETKKSRIFDLQMEIPKLKQRIEFLAKVLEIPVVK